MQTLGTAKAGDKLAARFLGKGSMLSGIIKVKAPLANQAQAEGIRSRWLAKHGGAAASGDVAVLDAETDFQPITIPPDQLQFLESRRWQTTEIARLFGIPPHLVGDVEKSTSWGTGIEQQNIGFVSYTIRGITSRIEQRVTREVVATRGKFAEFDLDQLMRGDTAERYQALLTACGGPWLTRNEARQADNRPKLKGAKDYDELLPPAGIAPIIDPIEAPLPGSTSNAPQNGGTDEGSQGAPANRAP
jgi:HK97 family phage portal protein